MLHALLDLANSLDRSWAFVLVAHMDMHQRGAGLKASWIDLLTGVTGRPVSGLARNAPVMAR